MLNAFSLRLSRSVRIAMCLSLIGTLVWTLAASSRAYAHAELTQSTPEANATLTAAPTQVMLMFSQGVDPSGSRFTVTGPDGIPVSQGDSQIDASNATAMSVELLPNLADGVYSVQWTSLSAEDGDEATGSFTFTIAAATDSVAVPTSPDTAVAQPDTTVAQPDTTQQQPDTIVTQPDTTQQQPANPLPVTAGEPTKTPSLAIAGCLLLLIAGTEFRRRARIAAENAAYAQDMADR